MGTPSRLFRQPDSKPGHALLLDSAWSFIPVVFFGVFFIICTSLEEHFLQGNLVGYREYAKMVHYRLLPGIW